MRQLSRFALSMKRYKKVCNILFLKINCNCFRFLCQFSSIIYAVSECVVISNYGGDFRGIPIDGEYRRLNETFFVKNDIKIEGETLMLIHKFKHSGWSGCKGNILGFERSSCASGGRWAYIPDIAEPRTGNVNIWSQKGDSSGILSRRCQGILFFKRIYTKRIIRLQPILIEIK